MNTDKRTIHTKLYSKIATEVLQSVVGQMSDGIWENSRSAEKYWQFMSVNAAPDGEVLIEIDAESGRYDKCMHKWLNNGFAEMTDADVIKWFANKVKQIMQIELMDKNVIDGWKRDNDKLKTDYLNYNENITVSDVYFIYDFLLGRDTANKYDAMMITEIIGLPKSDEATKAEQLRREQLTKLDSELLDARQKLDIEMRMKIAEIEREYDEKRKTLNDQYRAKRAAIMA